MKKVLAVLGLWLICAAALCAQTLRVAAYNVQNWNSCDRLVEGVYRMGYPKPEIEKAAVVANIVALRPDVLALEEMGPQEYLDELQHRLRVSGVVYPYAALLKGPDSARHLALLSKVPFEVFHFRALKLKYFDEERRVCRGLLEARFSSGAQAWRIFVVHLKSRASEREDDPQSEKLRIAEAQAIREQILRVTEPETAYLVVGDFNDAPRSSALKRFLQKGSRTLALMLPLEDSRGEMWTHRWEKEGAYSRIDYILASPAMHAAIVGGSGKIYDGPGVMLGSDHRPVMVEIDLAKIGVARDEAQGADAENLKGEAEDGR